MKLLTGLGNPGQQHAGNRHNIGFMAVDRIAADHGFSQWRARFQGLVSDGVLEGTRIVLLKPQTFMNQSGQAVGEAMRFYRLTPGDVTVLYDELDLAPGKVRAKTGGGSAGHNGIRSMDAHIGADFHRIRLGIGHPGHKDRVAGYVLSDFPKADGGWLEDLLQGISEGAGALAGGDPQRFMNAVALRTAPPRSSTAPRPQPDEGPKPGPAAVQAADGADLGPLQRLAARFRT